MLSAGSDRLSYNCCRDGQRSERDDRSRSVGRLPNILQSCQEAGLAGTSRTDQRLDFLAAGDDSFKDHGIVAAEFCHADNVSDNTFFQYTDEAGPGRILDSGKLKASNGKVYVTQGMYSFSREVSDSGVYCTPALIYLGSETW
jgi:hypothetical protein